MLGMLMVAALTALPVQQTDTTFAVRTGGTLHIENHQGAVVVRSWDRDAVRLRANHDAIRIRTDRSGGTASDAHIDTDHRRARGMPTIRYELTVPREFNLQIEGVNLEIDIADLQGSVDAETVNGTVTVSGVAGAIHIESIQGRITVGSSRGTLNAEGANEGINVDGFNGNVEVSTLNGSLVLRNITARMVDAETVNGRVEYSGSLQDDGRYMLSTHNGEVVLWVPEGTNAAVNIETYAGSVDTEFPVEMRRAGRNEVSFALGNGRGARVSIESFGGPVRIRRSR
ncbi:MAG: DUF4097 family beta strand repeat-containing protein [Gemmatimonadetes bacterium]|nr:DUF4097 family beta strand repeat-containing protein [Gemmatimonadota bacterium]